MKSTQLLQSFIRGNEEFIREFKNILKQHNTTIKEFAKKANIPENTIYKITTDKSKDFRTSTLRNIITTIKKIEGSDEEFIAVITSRGVLDRITIANTKLKGTIIKLKEFPALTIEEVITNAVKAEKLGAKGIVCGPIAAASIRNIVNIPIAAIHLDEKGVKKALENISGKI